MKTLRLIHLYLGCIFAPLLIFFAASGIWQTLDIDWADDSKIGPFLERLSTLHTGFKTKDHFTLSSACMKWLVIAMALSLIFSIVLGVIMAFKSGRKKAALLSLLAGILTPAAVIILTLW